MFRRMHQQQQIQRFSAHSATIATIATPAIRPTRPALARLAAAAIVVVGGVVAGIGCAEKNVRYDEGRGFYRAEEIQMLNTADDGSPIDVEALLARGEKLEETGENLEAAAYYLELARTYPTRSIALQARLRRTRVLVKERDFVTAHESMMTTVELYKEFLQLTRSQAIWDEMRRMWYDDIGLGLFFKDARREEVAENLDPAIRVFERLLMEEFRGKYAALCLLRIGDAYYAKNEFEKAKGFYLRVVKNYPDFQEAREHEEALYKAAEATLGTMKGADYNLDRIASLGSETEEKGALDLVADYLAAYPNGIFEPQVRRLRVRIYDVLAYRDLNAAQVYDRLGRDRPARYQYKLVVDVWGDPAKFPEQQTYVDKARTRLLEMGGAPNPADDK